MRPLLVLLAVIGMAACGPGTGKDKEEAALPVVVLEVGYSPDPLRSGQAVRWTLSVTNGGTAPATLTFPSGQDGDVVLDQNGRQAYRWSGGRFFTQAVRPVTLDAGATRTFTLEEERLAVEPGRYRLVATLRAEPAPAPARRDVAVE
jgi:uncharacterized protein (DUF58 family)